MNPKPLAAISLLAAIGSLLLLSSGCTKNCTEYAPASTATDYSQSAHWLSIPATVYKVDVFYLYPTAGGSKDSLPVITAVDDSAMMAGAAQDYARQATAFDTIANIYAPFYRQDNSSGVNRWNVIAGIPTTDATAAFDYYIKHFNSGRPFILLGHSQGSTVLTNLLSGYLKQNPKVYARMIAAYVIGSPISRDYLQQNPHLKFATSPDDVGVIVSWNTEGPNESGVNPVLYGMVGLVINPISWKTDQTLATMDQGLGSLFPRPPSKTFIPVPQCADAQIDSAKGVLIANVVPEYLPIVDLASLGQGFPIGVYHSFDIPFYYSNLRQNAWVRVQKWFGR